MEKLRACGQAGTPVEYEQRNRASCSPSEVDSMCYVTPTIVTRVSCVSHANTQNLSKGNSKINENENEKKKKTKRET